MCLSNSNNGKGKAVIWELGKESASIGNDTWENYWIAVGVQQWGIKAASTYTWTYPLPLAVVYYADMMGYRKGSAGSEYGWIRSISPIAFETYIIDESAICFCVGIAQQWGTIYNAKAGALDNNNNNNAVTFPMPFTTVFALSPTFIIEANHDNRDVIVNLYSLSNTGAVIRCWDFGNATNDGQLTYVALGKQQWGTNQPSPITFPVSFASKCLTVVPQLQASGDSGNMSKNRVCVTNLTARGFALELPQSTYNYIAIGI